MSEIVAEKPKLLKHTMLNHWNVMKLCRISDLSDNYLKMTCVCSNYEWWIQENIHIYLGVQFSKYENIFICAKKFIELLDQTKYVITT